MPYHTNQELLEAAERAVARASCQSELEEVGRTVKDQPIIAARFTKPGDHRPQVLLTGNVHGAEVIGSEVALAVIEELSQNGLDGLGAELLDVADVTVIPAVNLDSRGISIDGFLAGRLRCKAPRGNANGVDLNRNFPFPRSAKDVWYPISGTTVDWLPWYRGPEALSEPESRAIAELAAKRKFAASINLHSVSRLFLYPYCYSHEKPADLPAFLSMGEAYVSSQPHHQYKIKQSRSWYAILGDLDDYLYDEHGTLSVTVEVSKPLAGVGLNPLRLFCPFAVMNPRDPGQTIENNVDACLVGLAEGARIKLESREVHSEG